MTTLPIRQTVVDLCVELSQRGHFSGTGGNIALRIDATRIAVTPSATDYLTMTAADVCVLRLSDLVPLEGERAPSVESGLHARVLRARPDVQASIHTHQPVASACALLGRDLEVPPGALQRSLGVRVPMVGYAPSGSSWLSSKLARKLRGDINAYLMLNHGALCCGPSTSAALQAVEDLETLARTHLTRLIAARAEQQPHRQPALRRVTDALAG
ncbi:class II aldolase/adducin family protein [Rhizobacter sp. Root1221]|uniref:class II aldolase/adducin family protein n=1 Tax=Rhizobacter sp. Root1221 TaxID=1736433 RepID=UPI0006F5D13E|nr:class II aldolase/adducin family protein [Rhizobacter sp. Root1221]KQV81151.1 fuculose phosphate aldolase [Rhizobacter sp. Root1221]